MRISPITTKVCHLNENGSAMCVLSTKNLAA